MTSPRLTLRRRSPLSPRVAFVALATLSGAAGCSSGPSSVALEDIPHELAAALCDQLVSCGSARTIGGDIGYLVINPAFRDVCPDQFAREFGSLDYVQDAIDAGTLAYDARAAGRCIADVTGSCTIEGGFTFFPSCREIFQGLVPVGGTCSVSEECVAGSRCDAELVAGACTPGECVALLPRGSVCDDSAQCLPPEGTGVTLCRTNGGSESVCVALVFALGGGQGDPCGNVDEEGLERTYGMCGGEFFCDDPDEDGVGTCQPPLATGAVCTSSQACELGSLCLPAVMQSECTQVTLVTTAGGDCGADAACDFTARLVCVAGQCQALAAGACEDEIHCELDEYCDRDTSTCETRNPNGSVCDSSNECSSGRCVDDGTMTGTRRCSERVVCG